MKGTVGESGGILFFGRDPATGPLDTVVSHPLVFDFGSEARESESGE